ncbi:MAG TPA: lysylphosphatidylglycerol synthase domain-containing protein [Polyangiaceae bacterium]|nr:lysylphosphatidylglycerol synthase domain-containing protein [Polyangiaceae bacterium]
MLPSKRAFRIATRCVAIGVALLLLARVFRGADAAEVAGLLSGLGLGGAALLLLPQVAALTLETLGWKLTFRLGGSMVRFGALLRVRIATEALALSLPLGVAFAESIKPLLLGKHGGLTVERSIAGMTARKVLILVAQSLYVGALATAGLAGLEAASVGVVGAPHLGWWSLGAAAALGATGIAFVLSLRESAFAQSTLALLGGVPSRRFRAWLAERQRAFASTDGALSAIFGKPLRKLLAPTLLYAGGWLCEALETWAILEALGAHQSFVTVGSIEVVVSLIRNLVFVVPAGLGVQDLGYVSCFTAFGVPEAATLGAAFVLLKRGKELLWVLGGYVLLGGELGSFAWRLDAEARAAKSAANAR